MLYTHILRPSLRQITKFRLLRQSYAILNTIAQRV